MVDLSSKSERLGAFVQNPQQYSGDADILLVPSKGMLRLPKASQQMDSLYGFSIANYQGQVSATFSHRGQQDIVIVISDQFKILFRIRPGIERRLYGILLFCIKTAFVNKNIFLASVK